MADEKKKSAREAREAAVTTEDQQFVRNYRKAHITLKTFQKNIFSEDLTEEGKSPFSPFSV